MKRSKIRFAAFWAVALFLILPCISMQAKKPAFKNTRWMCEHKMLILDVGTMTENYTLEFTSAKDCILTYKWVIPAHPATYVKEDGTVDLIPSSGAEEVSRGTWRFSRGTLTLRLEDGSERSLRFEAGYLIDTALSTGELVYRQLP